MCVFFKHYVMFHGASPFAAFCATTVRSDRNTQVRILSVRDQLSVIKSSTRPADGKTYFHCLLTAQLSDYKKVQTTQPVDMLTA